MCGITGFWRAPDKKERDLKNLLAPMLNKIVHRGPDDEGMWFLQKKGLALGHRRLSIIDLSSKGHQPMHSQDGRYSLVYNGEIYNFKELRKSLEKKGVSFKSTSDTEVFIELISQEGLEKALGKINGMFGFALWDNKEQCLHLVRDRLGEKPVYWGLFQGDLLFGSELKALMAYPNFMQHIDKQSLNHYFSYGYVPEGKTIFQDIRKLLPGHIVTIQVLENKLTTSTKAYWQPEDCLKKEKSYHFHSFEKTQEYFEQLFANAVESRSITDVPIGCFLSGGIDSTMVTAFMQKDRKQPIKTFSVGFDAPGYDETPFAEETAKWLKTDHQTISLKESDVPGLFDKLINTYDEPFGDASQLPTLKVAELAAKEVTVVMSGDGGDEVFAGYNRYVFANDYLEKWFKTPKFLRKGLSATLQLSQKILENDTILNLLPSKAKMRFRPERFKRLNHVLSAKSLDEFYQRCVQIDIPPEMFRDLREKILLTSRSKEFDSVKNFQLQDLSTYLPGDILTKVDRATMAYSLEGRAPFLDHRVVEFGLQLPTAYKIKEGRGKYILRKTLEKYVPKSYFERPKIGFGLPLEIWLKEGLKSWCEDIMLKGKDVPFIDTAVMQLAWCNMPRKLSSGQSALIWRYLVWISWWKKYKKIVQI